ncbi:helix-turn-helix domain-containing protein [Zobellia sp.]|nr:helix-turn-helix domain-containing protein [Zobellia sp.]
MNNPFVTIVQELGHIREEISELRRIIPKNQSVKRYSPRELSKNTPLSYQTIMAGIKDGRIKAERFGRKYLITQEEFERVCKEAKSILYKRA